MLLRAQINSLVCEYNALAALWLGLCLKELLSQLCQLKGAFSSSSLYEYSCSVQALPRMLLCGTALQTSSALLDSVFSPALQCGKDWNRDGGA